MPPMQAGAPGGAPPAKTMFGYAAPQVPGRPGAPPQGGFAPPQQQGFAPPQPGQPPRPAQQPPQQQFGQPPQQQFGQPPQQQPGFGQPPQQQFGQPPQQQPGFGQPPQQQFGQPPQQQFGGPPQQQPGFGGPPPGQQPGFGGPPPGQPGFGQPPQQQFGGPPPGQQPGFGGPPPGQQPGFGGPPPGQQPGFGGPPPGQQPGFGGPPPQQPGFGGPQMGPPMGGPGPLGGLPTSPPGTLFGFPVSKLRDAGLQRTLLLFAGIALVASAFVPVTLSPFHMPISEGYTTGYFPIISGGLFLLVAAAPPNIRQQVPPVVLQWIPFVVSYWGIFTMNAIFGYSSLYPLAYALLVFGLLARIARPDDQIARIIIAVGGGLLVIPFLDIIGPAFKFGSGAAFPERLIIIIDTLLGFVMTALGVFCIVFVIPPAKLPPALKTVDNFGPLICGALLVWIVLHPVLIVVALILADPKHVVDGLLILAHVLLYTVSYFAILMMSAPAAYEEVMGMINKNKAGGGGPPPPQGGGGYPPPGGGYPPPGGGYPPAGGGYPQQGGGYPPQGGGGWQ